MSKHDWSQGWPGEQHISEHDPIARREIIRVSKDLAWVALALVLTLIMMSGLIKVDHYAGTYGVSIGTSNNYCSVEDELPVFTCEHVR